MKILFIRHAEAEPLREGVDDAKRHLTVQGHDDMVRRMALIRSYLSLQKKVELWASDFQRSIETAHYLEQGLEDVSTQTHKFLRKNKYDKLLDALQNVSCETLIVVGHNPMMAEWMEALTGEKVLLEPMEVCCLHFEEDTAQILWTWDYHGKIHLRPFVKVEKLSVPQWLEELAFSLHMDILSSRKQFEEGEVEISHAEQTRQMLAFLEIFSPFLQKKRQKKAVERYSINGEQSLELFYIQKLEAYLSEKPETPKRIVKRIHKSMKDYRKMLRKQILSFESQKRYHKAFRAVIKGLRAETEETLPACTESLIDFLEKTKAEHETSYQQVCVAAADNAEALFERKREWTYAKCAGYFLTLLSGEGSQEETQFPESAADEKYALLRYWDNVSTAYFGEAEQEDYKRVHDLLSDILTSEVLR